MISETLFILVQYHKIRRKYILILTVPCLQVATLGLSGAALLAPALPPLLPPAQGDQHRAGDLLPGRHGQGLSVSRQQQQHNRSQQQRGQQPTAEPQQFSFIAHRQSQETPGLVRIRDNPLHLISSHIKNISQCRELGR